MPTGAHGPKHFLTALEKFGVTLALTQADPVLRRHHRLWLCINSRRTCYCWANHRTSWRFPTSVSREHTTQTANCMSSTRHRSSVRQRSLVMSPSLRRQTCGVSASLHTSCESTVHTHTLIAHLHDTIIYFPPIIEIGTWLRWCDHCFYISVNIFSELSLTKYLFDSFICL